jgi:hypothetical protein
MSDTVLEGIQAIVQEDVNQRGLARHAEDNLVSWCQGDFVAACESLAGANPLVAGILTGFYIPSAAAAETDGPMGALLLARTLRQLGARVLIAVEYHAHAAMELALKEVGADEGILLKRLPTPRELAQGSSEVESLFWPEDGACVTHLIAVERVGPNHTWDSVESLSRLAGRHEYGSFRAQVPVEHWDHYHTMRGRIITEHMYPAHRFFEQVPETVTTIGIGDGGNEIGMGKIPWEIIARNVPGGGVVACRVPTDHNIVCGISNWGAHGLAAGVWHLRRQTAVPEWFQAEAERTLWDKVLRDAQPTLVDGMTGQRTLSVDGLSWDAYARPLTQMARLLEGSAS